MAYERYIQIYHYTYLKYGSFITSYNQIYSSFLYGFFMVSLWFLVLCYLVLELLVRSHIFFWTYTSKYYLHFILFITVSMFNPLNVLYLMIVLEMNCLFLISFWLIKTYVQVKFSFRFYCLFLNHCISDSVFLLFSHLNKTWIRALDL